MDNSKIDDNYTVSDQDSSFPFTNAIDPIRSRLFKTTGTTLRIELDLGWQDIVNTVILFAPLGEKLGISKEANVRLQADNVKDWASPELDLSIPMISDDRVVFFAPDNTELNYRFWSLYIDDPASSTGIISFAYIYMGDYLTTTARNIAPGFGWDQIHNAKEAKALDGTSYFDSRYKYDTFTSNKFSYVNMEDRQILQNLFNRKGKDIFFPVCIDPTSIISNSKEEMTKLVRFNTDLKSKHKVLGRFDVSFSLNEVI